MPPVVLPLPSRRRAASEYPELLERGEQAFPRIIRRIDEAQSSVQMRCFDWRDYETGNLLGEAMLRAAERGVSITIRKDLVGADYEYFEGNRQSFFHKDLPLYPRVQNTLFSGAYGKGVPPRQRRSALAETLLRHDNVTVHRHEKVFDHSKVYVIDDERIIIGGMGVGDDFRYDNIDYMVDLYGPEHIQRYRDRCNDRAALDASRRIEFLAHTRTVHGKGRCPLLHERLDFIASARRSLTVEMAYLGDPRFTHALIAAVRRGITVTLVTAARANVLGNLNLGTVDRLLRKTGAPKNLRVALHPRMVHSKVIVVDRAVVTVGSSNFTRISHGAYDEVDLLVRDETFAARCEDAVLGNFSGALHVVRRVPHKRVHYALERAAVAFQARGSARRSGQTGRASVPLASIDLGKADIRDTTG